MDFYLEIQLTHLAPKEMFTKSKDSNGKKGKARFKMGYLIIYVWMCIISAFMGLAFKDLGEYLEQQKNDCKPKEIMISHIF